MFPKFYYGLYMLKIIEKLVYYLWRSFFPWDRFLAQPAVTIQSFTLQKITKTLFLNLALCPPSGGSANARVGCCSSTNLCGFGRGTCTSNSDCQGNLVCDNRANAIATGRNANAASNNCGKYNAGQKNRYK